MNTRLLKSFSLLCSPFRRGKASSSDFSLGGSIPHSLVLSLVFSSVVLFPDSALSQKKPEAPKKLEIKPDAGNVEKGDSNPLAQKYLSAVEELREATKRARHEFVLYHTEFLYAKRFQRIEEWSKLTGDARLAEAKMLNAASELYRSDATKYASLGQMLFIYMKSSLEGDRFEGMAEVAKALVDGGYKDDSLLQMASQAAVAENQFDLAVEFLKKESKLASAEQVEASIKSLEEMKLRWNAELEIRNKEAAANDLPRVELMTSKGAMVIELFENEAPIAVNNFIDLVERGFFDGKTFFRVLEHFVAQSGCERGDGTGSAGYTIRGEMGEPNARKHFRGSLGMALGADPRTGVSDRNSASAQFYICFFPQIYMDNNYCVFGRVVEGLDRLGELMKVDLSSKEGKEEAGEAVPDQIVRAKVLRKRNHEYKATPFSGSAAN